MVHFVLQTFSQDEEIKNVHLPIVFAGILDAIEVYSCLSLPVVGHSSHLRQSQVQKTPERARNGSVVACWALLEVILDHLSQSQLLLQAPLSTNFEHHEQTPFQISCSFFQISSALQSSTRRPISAVPLVSCLQALLSLSQNYAEILLKGSHYSSVLRESFCRILALIHVLVKRLDSALDLVWNPTQWLENVLSCLGDAVSF